MLNLNLDNHSFYVQGRGFIQAGNLLVGDKLISVNDEDLIVEDYYIELTEEPVPVYNFQVEDFYTYFVAHHMPADSASPIPRNDDPCISMPFEDHAQTTSYDKKPQVLLHIEQNKLI